MRRQFLPWLLVAVVFLAFAWAVRPVGELRTTLRLGDKDVPVKVHRLTGQAEVLTGRGWVPAPRRWRELSRPTYLPPTRKHWAVELLILAGSVAALWAVYSASLRFPSWFATLFGSSPVVVIRRPAPPKALNAPVERSIIEAHWEELPDAKEAESHRHGKY